MAKKQLTYAEAQSEIEEILEKLNNEELDIDTLSSQVARAIELIKICKTRLRKVENEVEQLFTSFNED